MSAAALSSVTTAPAASTAGFASLTTQDFLKILLSELSHQDPLAPQDSSKLLEQFSSLRNIESQLKFQQTIENLILQWQIGAAGNLIGKLVSGLDDENNQVTGLVTSIRIENRQVYLELDTGQSLAMSRVNQIGSLWGFSDRF